MSDLQLLFGNASQALRFEIPSAWTSIPTAVNIQVEDNAGTEVLASVAATIGFAADTSAALTAINANTMTLTTGVALVPGDRVYIAAGATGSFERATVEHYNTSGKIITFDRDLKYAHASGVAVTALFFKYTYDVSSATTYPINKELTINWVPNNNQLPVSIRAKISKTSYQLQDFEKEFEDAYDQEYTMIRKVFPAQERRAKRAIASRIKAKGFDIDRAKDTTIFIDPTLEYICYLANKRSATDSRKSEMEAAMKEYNRLMAEIEESPIWFDDDQDDIKDDNEERPMYPPPGKRGLTA